VTGLYGEIASGLTATIRLSKLRGQVRTPRARLRTRIAAVIAGCLVVVAAMAGDIVTRLAQHADPSSPIYRYLLGDRAVSLAAALGTVLAGVLFSPISGAAAQAQFPDLDLASIRPSRLYRYFDGIWNSVLSPVGVSPLLMLVTAASLSTPDGRGRLGAIAMSLATWVCAMLVMALLAWTIEYTRRRWIATLRWYLAAAASLVVALAVIVDPAHGLSIFGLADWLHTIIHAGVDGAVLSVIGGTALVLVAAAVTFLGGVLVCRQALVLPAAIERVRQRSGSVKIPIHPSWALFTMLVTTLARTREVRRPIIMMIALAMPMLFVWIRYSGSDPSSMLGSVTMVVPLAIALGWGVNVFGVLGGAVTLLLAQPRAWKLLLRHIILVQLAASVGLGVLLMVLAIAISGMSWSALPPYTAGLVVSSVIATGLSVRYSVEKPYRTRLTGRGDPLVPPITGMGYVLRIMLTSATTGLAVAVMATLVPWLAVVAAAFVALSAFLSWRRVSKRWNDPAHRSQLAALVGAV